MTNFERETLQRHMNLIDDLRIAAARAANGKKHTTEILRWESAPEIEAALTVAVAALRTCMHSGQVPR